MSDEQVMMKLTVHARGQMATKLLAAAKELGYGPEVIRSQSDGFKVPVEVHHYLFPSEYENLPADDGDDPGPVTDPADDAVTELLDPAADFANNPDNLTDTELDKLTKPDGE